MSTQTAALPDGTRLTKPASGEKVSLSVINTNTDNIANNIIGLNRHFMIISSGSLHDILTTGMYYLTAAVTDKPTAAGGYYSVTVFSNDLLVGMFCSLDGNIFNIRLLNGSWIYQQTPSFRVVEGTQTTGPTGNIALGEQGTNKHFVIGATVLNVNAFVRPWRTISNQGWYLTVVDPNTGSPITNTSVDYRYMVIDLY